LFVVALGISNGVRGEDVEASDGETTPATEAADQPAGIVPSQTAKREQPRQPEERLPAGEVSAQAAAQNSSPLLDPSNVWTVVVITYSRSASAAEELAWATHDHLLEEGIPVFTPVEIGNKIVVLAGAAPRSSELNTLEERIGSLARDGRSNIYTGAYAERIEKFIDRN